MEIAFYRGNGMEVILVWLLVDYDWVWLAIIFLTLLGYIEKSVLRYKKWHPIPR
jgi:hypothetical protein